MSAGEAAMARRARRAVVDAKNALLSRGDAEDAGLIAELRAVAEELIWLEVAVAELAPLKARLATMEQGVRQFGAQGEVAA